MASKNEQDLVAFLAAEQDVAKEDITIWTRLREDLRIDGDEAAEFLANYAYAFHVDIDNFRFNDYFNTGGNIAPLLAWWLWLFGNGKPLKTLTVRDLIKGADQGYLA